MSRVLLRISVPPDDTIYGPQSEYKQSFALLHIGGAYCDKFAHEVTLHSLSPALLNIFVRRLTISSAVNELVGI